MNEHTTPSILQRVPVILAVTAESYGLPVQDQGQFSRLRAVKLVSTAATASLPEQPARDSAPLRH